MVSGPVTDPELLAQLEGGGATPPKSQPVTDPTILSQLEGGNTNPVEKSTGQDWASKIYTPLIEGTAMAISGGAAGIAALPAGPIASGMAGIAGGGAMFPPAKRFAASIDAMRGIDNPVSRPKTNLQELGDVASDFGEGIEREATGRAIQAAAPAALRLFRSGAKKAASVGQAVTGARSNDIMTAYDKGLKTYASPSMKKAGKIFEDAAVKSGAKMDPGLEDILDPQLQHAKDVALRVGNKIRGGETLTPQEALSGRQAVDFIKESTPFWQRKKLKFLSNLRDEFADAVAQTSPELKQASDVYRAAKVKSTLLKPMRINKRGDYSALLPMLGTVATAASRNPAAILPTAGAILGTSPLAAGVGAAVSGEAARGVGKLMSNPVTSRAIASKVLDSVKAREYLKKAKGDKDLARKLAKADGWQF